MSEPPASASEAQRLAALRRYQILDTPPEDAFDRITRLVSHLLDVPIALITLLDHERQWFKSCIGLDTRETSREVAFCAYNLHDEEIMVVEDATRDERFADNPLVTGDPGIRFYAGAPLVTPDGHVLGSVCALDTEPRSISEAEAERLRDLAAMVVDKLELRATRHHRTDILESITNAFYVVDDNWRFTYVNQQAEILLERSRAELVGENVWEQFPEATELPVYEEYHRAVATGEPTKFEIYFPPLDRWFEVHAHPFEGGLSVYFDDISDRKARNEQLRLMSRAVENAAEAVLITGPGVDEPGPRIEYVNPAFERITGYAAEEVIGRTPRLLQGPETDRATLDAVRDALEAGKLLTKTTTVNYRKDGTRAIA